MERSCAICMSRSAGPSFFARADGGMTLRIKVVPRGPYDRIQGTMPDAEGKPVLKVIVTAAPEDGKANAAVVKLLAKAWRLPKTAFSVKVGATDRNKVLFVEGDPSELEDRLIAWMEEHG